MAQELPHPWNQLVANPLGVLLVAGQLGLQRLVFPPRPQDQQARRQARRDQRPQGTQAQGAAHEEQHKADVAGVTDNGVRAGVDDLVATVRLNAHGLLEKLVHGFRPGKNAVCVRPTALLPGRAVASGPTGRKGWGSAEVKETTQWKRRRSLL